MSDYMKEAERLLAEHEQAAGLCCYADCQTTRAALLAHIQRGAVPEGYGIAPTFRGYAKLGSGHYVLHNCPRTDEDHPSLVIAIATEEEKAGRQVGELRQSQLGLMIQPERIAVRIDFKSVAALDALEQQLRFLREDSFPGSLAAPAPDQFRGAAKMVPAPAEVPMQGRWHLDESESALLHHLTSPDDDGEHSPVTLRAGLVREDDGTVKLGLLCEYTDYPDEGATLLVECHPIAKAEIPEDLRARLVEAWDYGQFNDDFDQPLAKRIRADIRTLCELLSAVPAPDHFRDAAVEKAWERFEAELQRGQVKGDAAGMVAKPAEVPMPEPIGFIDSNDDETWATLTQNSHELATLKLRSTVFHVSQMRTYGAACRAAGEAAGYARGLAEANRYRHLRALVVSDSYAATFQSLAQYRIALLKSIDEPWETAQHAPRGEVKP